MVEILTIEIIVVIIRSSVKFEQRFRFHAGRQIFWGWFEILTIAIIVVEILTFEMIVVIICSRVKFEQRFRFHAGRPFTLSSSTLSPIPVLAPFALNSSTLAPLIVFILFAGV